MHDCNRTTNEILLEKLVLVDIAGAVVGSPTSAQLQTALAQRRQGRPSLVVGGVRVFVEARPARSGMVR